MQVAKWSLLSRKNPEVSNVRGARAKHGGISGVLRTVYRKKYTANQ